jgi:hydroxypyruvate isomerase
MRFSANLSLLFADVPFADRFEAAANAGLEAVEFWWPGDADARQAPELASALGLDIAMFNFNAGDMASGDRGLLSDPDRQAEFRANVPIALEIARRANCTRLNALVGTSLDGLAREEQLRLAAENIGWAADEAQASGVTILIEAVNTFENGPYLLASTAEAAQFLERVGRENVRLQYDAYHMQRMEGNITQNLRDHIDRIGHVQIADSPDRGEPGTGEIDYRWVLSELERLGYDGFVGLEYKPSGGPDHTMQSLRRFSELGFWTASGEAPR